MKVHVIRFPGRKKIICTHLRAEIWTFEKILGTSFDKLIWMGDKLLKIAAPEIDRIYGKTPKLLD